MINKTEFIAGMAEANGISKKQAGEEVGRVLDHIEASVAQDSVNLTGYVKFNVKEVAERQARNPQTGEEITVPAGRQVRASAGKRVKEAVK